MGCTVVDGPRRLFEEVVRAARCRTRGRFKASPRPFGSNPVAVEVEPLQRLPRTARRRRLNQASQRLALRCRAVEAGYLAFVTINSWHFWLRSAPESTDMWGGDDASDVQLRIWTSLRADPELRSAVLANLWVLGRQLMVPSTLCV